MIGTDKDTPARDWFEVSVNPALDDYASVSGNVERERGCAYNECLSVKITSRVHFSDTFVMVRLLAVLLVFLPAIAVAEEILLIADGRAKNVIPLGSDWKTVDDGYQGTGTNHRLFSGKAITAGDFEITAKLRLLNQKQSAAGFFLEGGVLGFEGRKAEELFTGGSWGYRNLGKSADVFSRGDWFTLTVRRTAKVVTFLIDGQVVYTRKSSQHAVQQFGFLPWRSTMQIQSWRVSGTLEDAPRPKSRGYSLPLIDLADQKQRQVLVDREPGQYLGHPTTVLLEDGKTILCVYPKGHGRGPIVMKRSTDGGLTWSNRLPTPDNWSTSKETPTIYRTVDAQGTKRLILFSGLHPIRMAVSEDDGETWTPLKPIGNYGGIVAMGDVVRLTNDHYMAFFHDDGRFFRAGGRQESSAKFHVYKTVSSDGGLTWGEPEIVARHPQAHLCEPGVIRSPDGKQLCILLRENSRRLNSFVIFSNDEGQTWSEPKQLPGALTGDRHQAKYAADGRLVISFRDTTHESPTRGDWVAWVGTYADIVNGREGQYRIRLMDNHSGQDCAYPGVLVLPDQTFVLTTYGHWTPGEKPYIVSVRFTLAELDAMAKNQQSPPASPTKE